MAERPQARRQARLAWWLLLAPLAAAGLLVVAALVSASAVRLDMPSADRLIDACRSLIPRIGLRPALELIAASVAFGVTARAASCALVEFRGLRRYRVAVATSRPVRLGPTDVWIHHDDRPLAFTGGWLRPRIHLSTATLRCLTADELAAVIAHEDRHRRQRDPLRMVVARTTARTFAFLPGVSGIADRHASTIELAADEAAGRAASRKSLAGALLRLGTSGDGDSGPQVCGIAPERVDRLSGRPTSRLDLRNALRLLFGALSLAFVAVESLEAARTTPIDIALVAAQICSAGALGLALTVLLVALCRHLPDRARSR